MAAIQAVSVSNPSEFIMLLIMLLVLILLMILMLLIFFSLLTQVTLILQLA
jgi:hypothetical protein